MISFTFGTSSLIFILSQILKRNHLHHQMHKEQGKSHKIKTIL
jgi:hypothetical protein